MSLMAEDWQQLFLFILPALLFIAVSLLISVIGGWRSLASAYLLSDPFPAGRWWFQSARMRFGLAYNGCLIVGADQRGLYISIFFLFRIGHPPLFIPWQDVSISFGRSKWFGGVTLRFKNEPQVPFRISETLAKRLRAVAGSAWTPETARVLG
jgi:hypothetical protein